MANTTANLNITTSLGHNFNYSLTSNYNEVFQTRQVVDNSNAFIDMLNTGTSIAAQTLRNLKLIVIHNTGNTTLEIQTTIQAYKNSSDADIANSVDLGGGATELRFINYLLPAGEFMFLPNNRCVSYEGEAGVSACNATTLSNVLPADINSGNEYTDSTADTTEGFADDDDNTITFDDASGGVAHNMFRVNDLIRIDDEVMRITSIVDTAGDGAYTPAHFIVERALYGTTKADHSNNAAIRFPFFNAYHDFDKFTLAQTDRQGRFMATNFFGYGRTADAVSDGIVPGSVAIAFYSEPSARFGMNNIGTATESGLTAGTTYEFAINPGSTEDLIFTVDTSNTKFGGNNGIIRKIQAALDAKFYDSSSNFFEKRISVSIAGGDLSFRLHESLSTSSLTVGRATDISGSSHLIDTGTTNTGRFPGADEIPGAVSPSLPRATGFTGGFSSYEDKLSSFMTDNGKGALSGPSGGGSIDYNTGAIQFTGSPLSEFTISATYKSAMGGSGDGTTSNAKNVINKISARTTSAKKDGVCTIVAFN